MTAATATPALPTTFLQLDTQAPYYKWLVAAIVLVAGATQTFAGPTINIAIPRLMAAFGTDLAQTQWVATAWLLTRTLVMPLLGWLGGMLGNRNLFVAIMVGFIITTAGCGLATSLPMMITFRLLQGLVMGTAEGLTTVIMVSVFPPHQRGMALGLRAVGWSTGQIIFYTAGGYLMEEVSWRLIFFIGIPTGIIAAVSGFLVLPKQRDYKSEPIDSWGLVALGSFLVPLLLVISFGRDDSTAASTLFWLALGAIGGGALFVMRELLTPYPIVNLHLFRLPIFRLICITAFFNNMGLFGAMFIVPIFLQQVIGLSPLQAGLVLVPALIVSGFSGILMGRMADLFPPPAVVITVMLALTVIFYSFSSVSALTALPVIVGYVILYRVCMTGSVTPLALLAVRQLEADQVRMGQGLLGVTRSIGSSLGVTVTSVVFERRRVWHQLTAYDTYNADSPVHRDTLAEVIDTLQQAGMSGAEASRAALGALRRQMDVGAITSAFQDSFLLVCTCFLCASLPMIYLLFRSRHSR
ncbi:MAG: DHA2 family efflux MFS transporter permease subunit [Candidatus Tectomicrobia bacterium]